MLSNPDCLQVVKKLWEYIREKDLQDPKNRRNIKCDEKLHSIFRVDTINMFQMNKALSKHIWPLEVDQGNVFHLLMHYSTLAVFLLNLLTLT